MSVASCVGCCLLRSQGECEAEHGTLTRYALYPDLASEVRDDLPADGQSESGPLRLPGKSVPRLPEFVEDHLLALWTDARAVISHVYASHARVCTDPDTY